MAVLVIIRLVRRGSLKAKYSVLWLTVGLVLAVAASVPTLLDRLADRLGIWYQPTLFLLLAIGFLLLVAMHFSYELSRLEKRVRALAEELALLRGPVEGSGSSSNLSASPDGNEPRQPPRLDGAPDQEPDQKQARSGLPPSRLPRDGPPTGWPSGRLPPHGSGRRGLSAEAPRNPSHLAGPPDSSHQSHPGWPCSRSW